MAYIEAAGIAKSFPAGAATRPVLRGVSLSVERGEFVSIVGAMGSGKSTLLSILAGLTPADEGTVVLNVPFPRPRNRTAVLGRADYHAMRRQVIDFLEHHAHQSRPSALDRVLRQRTKAN